MLVKTCDFLSQTKIYNVDISETKQISQNVKRVLWFHPPHDQKSLKTHGLIPMTHSVVIFKEPSCTEGRRTLRQERKKGDGQTQRQEAS